MPVVARRQVTFFASPKKVTKERRPEVRRPRKGGGGSLRYSNRQAAAELGLDLVSRKSLQLRSPSNSPRGHPLSLLRYSATLIGLFRSPRLSLRPTTARAAMAGLNFEFNRYILRHPAEAPSVVLHSVCDLIKKAAMPDSCTSFPRSVGEGRDGGVVANGT